MQRNYKEISIWKDVSEDEWNSWKWQLANRITTLKELAQVVDLTPQECDGIKVSLNKLKMVITPYYATLMHKTDAKCPIRMQAIPTVNEANISKSESSDPLHESADSFTNRLTHRYPDRVLLLITDQCAMYCRHCTRRRFAGQQDNESSTNDIDNAIEYIKQHREIRDVLLSGGDALCVSNAKLEYILNKLKAIKHVEVIRLGTRTPVVMPQRITDELCEMLSKYHPIWINTHFNHPNELTPEAIKACNKLSNVGIPLGNQSVLLKGINDCTYIMKNLVQDLVKARIRPYYLYQCDLSEGIEHFRTPVSVGIEIIEMLRGHTSGFAVPQFVIDAPGGGGKIPINPNYVISQSHEKVILRNYEGIICSYDEPTDKTQDCKSCGLCNKYENDENRGVEKIFKNERKSLIPRSNVRINRRKKHHECNV